MALQLSELVKVCGAVDASELEHAGVVRAQVRFEVGGGGLSLAAVRAVIGEDAGVQLAVLLQVLGVAELRAAFPARVLTAGLRGSVVEFGEERER